MRELNKIIEIIERELVNNISDIVEDSSFDGCNIAHAEELSENLAKNIIQQIKEL